MGSILLKSLACIQFANSVVASELKDLESFEANSAVLVSFLILLLFVQFGVIVYSLFLDHFSPSDLPYSTLFNQSQKSRCKLCRESVLFQPRHVNISYERNRQAYHDFYSKSPATSPVVLACPNVVSPSLLPSVGSVTTCVTEITCASDFFWRQRSDATEEDTENHFWATKIAFDVESVGWSSRDSMSQKVADLSFALDKTKSGSGRVAILVSSGNCSSAKTDKDIVWSSECAMLTIAAYSSQNCSVVHLPALHSATQVGTETIVQFAENLPHLELDIVLVDDERGIHFVDKLLTLSANKTSLPFNHVIVLGASKKLLHDRVDDFKTKWGSLISSVNTFKEFEELGSFLRKGILKEHSFTGKIEDYFLSSRQLNGPDAVNRRDRIISYYYSLREVFDDHGKCQKEFEIVPVSDLQMTKAVTALAFHFPSQVSIREDEIFLSLSPNFCSYHEHLLCLWSCYRNARLAFLRYSKYHPVMASSKQHGESGLSHLLSEISLLQPSFMFLPSIALTHIYKHLGQMSKDDMVRLNSSFLKFFDGKDSLIPTPLRSALEWTVRKIESSFHDMSIYHARKSLLNGRLYTPTSASTALSKASSIFSGYRRLAFGSKARCIITKDAIVPPQVLQYFHIYLGCQVLNSHCLDSCSSVGISNMNLYGDYLPAIVDPQVARNNFLVKGSSNLSKQRISSRGLICMGLVGPVLANHCIKLLPYRYPEDDNVGDDNLRLSVDPDNSTGRVSLFSPDDLAEKCRQGFGSTDILFSRLNSIAGFVSTGDLFKVTEWGSFQHLGRIRTMGRDFVSVKGKYRDRVWRIRGVPLLFLEGLYRSLVKGVADIILVEGQESDEDGEKVLGAHVIATDPIDEKYVVQGCREALESNIELLPETLMVEEWRSMESSFRTVLLDDETKDDLILHFAVPRGHITIESDPTSFYSWTWNGSGHGAVRSCGDDMMYSYGLRNRWHTTK